MQVEEFEVDDDNKVLIYDPIRIPYQDQTYSGKEHVIMVIKDDEPEMVQKSGATRNILVKNGILGGNPKLKMILGSILYASIICLISK